MIKVYKKWFAARLADDPSQSNPVLIEYKQNLLGHLHGKVLEIGPGTGGNFKYFPRTISWFGLEPNPYMTSYIDKQAHVYHISRVELTRGEGEHIPYADRTFDAVVSTHVLCSVKNPEQTVKEIYRVLKPGGSFVFIEHCISENKLRKFIQTVLTPLWKIIADGCHLQRNLREIILDVPFKRKVITSFHISIPVIGDHVAGKMMR